MKLTEHKIRTLSFNIYNYIKGKTDNIFENRYPKPVPEKVMTQLRNIMTFYNNNYFTIRQLLLYITYYSLTDDNFHGKIYSWDTKHIADIDNLFTPDQLKKDKEIIKNLSKKNGLKISDYMMINSSGDMISLELMKKKFISPIFVIRFKDLIAAKSKPSDETARMLRIVSALERILKTDLL